MTMGDKKMNGEDILALAKRLFPIHRSLTGDGVRATLSILREHLPGLVTHEVPTGTQVFDWTVPKEWRVRSAHIAAPDGRKLCNVAENNLHLMGYSTPVDARLSLDELQPHLYSLEDKPEAIPYMASYYKERWGFCLPHSLRTALPDGEYRVLIDTDLFEGSLSYGECVIPGETEEEVLLSTYVCHPSMANNEVSGPSVQTAVGCWLSALPRRRYTYRLVFLPETIGALAFVSRNLDQLRRNVKAGYVITCIGDDRAYSLLPSRRGTTRSDNAARHAMRWHCPDYITYPWRERGSDERQYCSPGIDLPMASIMRSKYGEYPEYHTSLDDFSVVTASGLAGGFEAVRMTLLSLEMDCRPLATCLGEPQLGKRGLYPTLSTPVLEQRIHDMLGILTWADGENTLLEIAEKCDRPIWELHAVAELLRQNGLLKDA